MKAKDGVRQFLVLPAIWDALSKDDIEQAIAIASQNSPSSAFDRAQVYMTAKQTQMKALGFAKGVRWLAMVRRDDGQDAFDQQSKELRELFK